MRKEPDYDYHKRNPVMMVTLKLWKWWSSS